MTATLAGVYRSLSRTQKILKDRRMCGKVLVGQKTWHMTIAQIHKSYDFSPSLLWRCQRHTLLLLVEHFFLHEYLLHSSFYFSVLLYFHCLFILLLFSLTESPSFPTSMYSEMLSPYQKLFPKMAHFFFFPFICPLPHIRNSEVHFQSGL